MSEGMRRWLLGLAAVAAWVTYDYARWAVGFWSWGAVGFAVCSGAMILCASTAVISLWLATKNFEPKA